MRTAFDLGAPRIEPFEDREPSTVEESTAEGTERGTTFFCAIRRDKVGEDSPQSVGRGTLRTFWLALLQDGSPSAIEVPPTAHGGGCRSSEATCPLPRAIEATRLCCRRLGGESWDAVEDSTGPTPLRQQMDRL